MLKTTSRVLGMLLTILFIGGVIMLAIMPKRLEAVLGMAQQFMELGCMFKIRI